ncbi:MAG: ABC transporter permease, partial [Rhodospirillales bacterium]
DNPYAYALYLTAGMVAWSFFSEIVTRCLTVFIDNGHLMKKVAFPRIALPLIALGTAGVNNLLLIVAGLVVFALLGHLPGPTLVLLPALAVLTAAFALGVGLVLGILNVFVRDIGQAVPLVLQILFWFTPIVYVPDIVPASVRALLPLNPLYPIVRAYQDVLVFGRLPSDVGLVVVAALAAGLLALALTLFRRAGPEMTDQL